MCRMCFNSRICTSPSHSEHKYIVPLPTACVFMSPTPAIASLGNFLYVLKASQQCVICDVIPESANQSYRWCSCNFWELATVTLSLLVSLSLSELSDSLSAWSVSCWSPIALLDCSSGSALCASFFFLLDPSFSFPFQARLLFPSVRGCQHLPRWKQSQLLSRAQLAPSRVPAKSRTSPSKPALKPSYSHVVLRSSGLKVRRAQVDFATSWMAEVFEYSKTDSRVVKWWWDFFGDDQRIRLF